MESSEGPITDLDRLVEGLAPILLPERFVFVDLAGCGQEELFRARVEEPEGPSGVMTEEDAELLELDFGQVWAWITLAVPSALEAVGLIALVSSRLAEAGIPCNVIAGLRHDHLLVPYEARERALEALRRLSEGR